MKAKLIIDIPDSAAPDFSLPILQGVAGTGEGITIITPRQVAIDVDLLGIERSEE